MVSSHFASTTHDARRATERVRMWRRHDQRKRWAWMRRMLVQLGLADA